MSDLIKKIEDVKDLVDKMSPVNQDSNSNSNSNSKIQTLLSEIRFKVAALERSELIAVNTNSILDHLLNKLLDRILSRYDN